MTLALKPKREAKPRFVTAPRPVVYPTSDGKPMAETDKHVDLMLYGRGALLAHYSDRKDSVYVAGNNFVFYEEGNPRARISPDLYVVFDIPMRLRDSYKVWDEGGKMPAIVVEFTSRKTRTEDTGRKFTLYEQILKVPEYVVFDPTGDYLTPRIRGWRLQDGAYVPIPLQGDRLHSEQLGLDLVIEGERLRFYDPIRQRFLPSQEEAILRASAESQRAEEEAQRAAAEAGRAEAALQRADSEAQRADAESQRADAEARAKQEAEEENARLRAELDALRRALSGG